jgi:hypothetical protein
VLELVPFGIQVRVLRGTRGVENGVPADIRNTRGSRQPVSTFELREVTPDGTTDADYLANFEDEAESAVLLGEVPPSPEGTSAPSHCTRKAAQSEQNKR